MGRSGLGGSLALLLLLVGGGQSLVVFFVGVRATAIEIAGRGGWDRRRGWGDGCVVVVVI